MVCSLEAKDRGLKTPDSEGKPRMGANERECGKGMGEEGKRGMGKRNRELRDIHELIFQPEVDDPSGCSITDDSGLLPLPRVHIMEHFPKYSRLTS
jgi:hypothetical protein